MIDAFLSADLPKMLCALARQASDGLHVRTSESQSIHCCQGCELPQEEA